MEHPLTQVTLAPSSPDPVPCDFWVFPELNAPLKGGSRQPTLGAPDLRAAQGRVHLVSWLWGVGQGPPGRTRPFPPHSVLGHAPNADLSRGVRDGFHGNPYLRMPLETFLEGTFAYVTIYLCDCPLVSPCGSKSNSTRFVWQLKGFWRRLFGVGPCVPLVCPHPTLSLAPTLPASLE